MAVQAPAEGSPRPAHQLELASGERIGYDRLLLATDWDQVVVRGGLAAREFIAFWLKDQRVIAGMHANVWDVVEPIQALIRDAARSTPEHPANPDIAFDDRLAHQP